MDNFNDDYHDLNKLFSGIGLSRSPRQLIDEALSIAIPVMIKASVSPSNLDDLMLMSRALNRGNLGMLYHNVDDFINQIGEDIENGKIDAISKKNPLIPKMAEPWLDQWRSTSNRNRPYKHRLISQPTADNGEKGDQNV